MTATEFCYWLRGHLELASPTVLSEQQVAIINDHLDLVFKKETPCYQPVFPIATCAGGGVASAGLTAPTGGDGPLFQDGGSLPDVLSGSLVVDYSPLMNCPSC